ncbi:MAG: pilus assembly protein N-terminal domain-containing protein, partial [Limisphaerales bacterium]
MNRPKLNMKYGARLCSALVLFGWIGTAGLRGGELTVVKGATTQIAVPEGIKNIVVQKKEIVDARPAADGKTLTVAGLVEGTSDLRIERLQGAELLYKVTVRADLQKMIDEIKELLADVEGVEIKEVGSKIWLRGNVATKTGYDMVEKVAEAYGGTVINGTKLDRSTTGKILCRLILDDIGVDSINARLVEDTVILEGVVYSKADADRAVQLAERRNPKVLNLMSVQQAVIETDVKFIQVATDNNTDFGFNVLDSLNIQAQGGVQGGNTGKPSLTYGVTGTASAKINALLGSNRAKLLNEQNVSANSGE